MYRLHSHLHLIKVLVKLGILTLTTGDRNSTLVEIDKGMTELGNYGVEFTWLVMHDKDHSSKYDAAWYATNLTNGTIIVGEGCNVYENRILGLRKLAEGCDLVAMLDDDDLPDVEGIINLLKSHMADPHPITICNNTIRRVWYKKKTGAVSSIRLLENNFSPDKVIPKVALASGGPYTRSGQLVLTPDLVRKLEIDKYFLHQSPSFGEDHCIYTQSYVLSNGDVGVMHIPTFFRTVDIGKPSLSKVPLERKHDYPLWHCYLFESYYVDDPEIIEYRRLALIRIKFYLKLEKNVGYEEVVLLVESLLEEDYAK